MGPISATFARLYGPTGWIVLGAAGAGLFIVIPVFALAVPPGSAFHVSQYWVTLIGKIMCYAIVALAMDLIWATRGSCRWATGFSSRSAATRWACI